MELLDTPPTAADDCDSDAGGCGGTPIRDRAVVIPLDEAISMIVDGEDVTRTSHIRTWTVRSTTNLNIFNSIAIMIIYR